VTAQALPSLRRRPTARVPTGAAWLALATVTIGLYIAFRGEWTLPHERSAPLFGVFNDARDALAETRRSVPWFGAILDGIRGFGTWLAESAIDGLIGVGWPVVIAVTGALALVFGGWPLAVLAAGALALVGALGLWEPAMQTLGLTLAAVALSLLFGIPLGILAGKSERVQAALAPVLDALQIMPQFAYLIPFVILFQIGPGPAALVTMLYAMPATIRITALGIRGVPSATLEAARSLGTTPGQALRKVELPLAGQTIGIAVNQTIMLAVSMVVITALINGPGLGVTILRAVQVTNVGAALEAGLAIVLIAIVLDRLTEQATVRLDPRSQASYSSKADRPRRGPAPIAIVGLLAVVGVVLVMAVIGGRWDEFPEEASGLTFREPVNDIVGWVRINLFFLTDTLKEVFTAVVLNPLEGVLTQAPFWLVIGAGGAVALLVSGVRAALIVVACLLGIVGLQLWEHAMETLATVAVATAITMTLGVGFGIGAALNARFSRGLRPVLDAAQTLPAFVYLLPAIALFSASRFTAIVAAVIFAVPPVVRLVEAGIRSVPAPTVEAARSAGASTGQLLRKVQLPIARPAILVATNQGIVMVLGMVVLGGLVGAGALGYDVVAGFSQRNDFGMGVAAGIAIVLLGIALDRTTHGAGRRRQVAEAGLSRP